MDTAESYSHRQTEAEIEQLVNDLNCDDVITCQRARRALVAAGEAAVPHLTEALSSKRQWVRWEAAKALGQIRSPSATQALLKALEDKNFDVRWLSAEALVNIGRKAVEPLLSELTRKGHSQWFLENAHNILHDLRDPALHDILRPVIAALEGSHPSIEVPVAAHHALEELRRLQE